MVLLGESRGFDGGRFHFFIHLRKRIEDYIYNNGDREHASNQSHESRSRTINNHNRNIAHKTNTQLSSHAHAITRTSVLVDDHEKLKENEMKEKLYSKMKSVQSVWKTQYRYGRL